MTKKVAVFWPGDARAKPNEVALPSVEAATQQRMSSVMGGINLPPGMKLPF